MSWEVIRKTKDGIPFLLRCYDNLNADVTILIGECKLFGYLDETVMSSHNVAKQVTYFNHKIEFRYKDTRP